MQSFAKIITPLKAFVVMLFFFANCSYAIEYIVKLRHPIDDYDLKSFTSPTSPIKVADVVKDLRLIKVDTSKLNSMTNPKILLSEFFDAEYVVENVKVYSFLNVNDPKRAQQWALDIVNAQTAWDISFGSRQVIVAVIDTGIDLSHEDLVANKWVNSDEIAGNNNDDDNNGYIDDINGWDFKNNDNNPNDEVGMQNPGHGTHCAGIIGATCNNGLGVCGGSPEVSLMAIRFLGSDGSGDLFASVKAIQYAANNGAHIINASWGAAIGLAEAQPIIDAIKAAEDKGVIFVAAAGNDGKSNDGRNVFPANAQTPNMISVAASTRNDQKASWSNFGRKVDIASPGDGILSTIPGDYKELSGTSMAAPLVAGLVALMKSVDISLTGAVARSILQSTGKEVTIETASKRRVDAYEALEAVKNKQLTVVPAALTLLPNAEANMSAWGGVAPYTFLSLAPNIATIDADGHLVAVALGDAIIEVTDSLGNKARTVSVHVGNEAPVESSCPLPNEFICLIMCGILPDLPWCADMPDVPDLPELPELPGLPK